MTIIFTFMVNALNRDVGEISEGSSYAAHALYSLAKKVRVIILLLAIFTKCPGNKKKMAGNVMLRGMVCEVLVPKNLSSSRES